MTSLAAAEVLVFFCSLRTLAHLRIDEVLAGTGFSFNGFAAKPVGNLLGGMLQRLGLAVACLPDTPVLVLDEPIVNLDPEGAVLFRRFKAAAARARFHA